MDGNSILLMKVVRTTQDNDFESILLNFLQNNQFTAIMFKLVFPVAYNNFAHKKTLIFTSLFFK